MCSIFGREYLNYRYPRWREECIDVIYNQDRKRFPALTVEPCTNFRIWAYLGPCANLHQQVQSFELSHVSTEIILRRWFQEHHMLTFWTTSLIYGARASCRLAQPLTFASLATQGFAGRSLHQFLYTIPFPVFAEICHRALLLSCGADGSAHLYNTLQSR